ncbi:MAG: hypothetical protein VBE63_23250 [Lamprobacter sp.]|uniref:hypothetical protein n=1 Tax=Lamprobacter sp. TaxID=3100796 RepID=UPI002B2569C6|nr:hypothetical protein [Lamprobacter sp.]MEA3642833.1 hypothetical protein [Lamprobacter sp.]
MQQVDQARLDQAQARALRLSYLIRGVGDLYVVPIHRAEPSFITRARVEAPRVRLHATSLGGEALSGWRGWGRMPANHLANVTVSGGAMEDKSLRLRCLIEQEGALYLAYCIDLGLGVQADSAREARERLHAAIDDYLSRVTAIDRAGDRQGAQRLLRRAAPWDLRLRYWLAWLGSHLRRLGAAPARQWAEDYRDPLGCV